MSSEERLTSFLRAPQFDFEEDEEEVTLVNFVPAPDDEADQ